MAATFNRLRPVLLRASSRRPYRRKQWIYLPSCRLFHSTPTYNLRIPDEDDSSSSKEPPEPYTFDYEDLNAEGRQHYDPLSPEEKIQFQKDCKEYSEFRKVEYEHMTSPAVESELQGLVSEAVSEIQRGFPPPGPRPRITPGLMAMGEVDEQNSGEDDEFDGDDISSIAHGELEQHREIREYARIAAWEMPMLGKYAKPFELPSKDKPLRFRYTTYMGETHPAAKKIVLEFCTRDLPDLTEAQRIKFVKLVGVRYNPETDLVKMSCEMFETQAQNKRYLGDLVDTLMAEAKDPTDMFEDIPMDFRHHKWKPKLEFPEKWKMTEQRKEQLEANWRQRALKDQERKEAGQLVDGPQIIEKMLETVALRTPAAAAIQPPRGQSRQRTLTR